MKSKLQITVCAFSDKKSNSIAYKKFLDVGNFGSQHDLEEVLNFYHQCLKRKEVNVVSTRKVYVSGKSLDKKN